MLSNALYNSSLARPCAPLGAALLLQQPRGFDLACQTYQSPLLQPATLPLLFVAHDHFPPTPSLLLLLSSLSPPRQLSREMQALWSYFNANSAKLQPEQYESSLRRMTFMGEQHEKLRRGGGSLPPFDPAASCYFLHSSLQRIFALFSSSCCPQQPLNDLSSSLSSALFPTHSSPPPPLPQGVGKPEPALPAVPRRGHLLRALAHRDPPGARRCRHTTTTSSLIIPTSRLMLPPPLVAAFSSRRLLLPVCACLLSR